MIDELQKIIKNKYNKLKGLNNIDQCINNCSIIYNDDNAIIKNNKNEYLIDYEFIGVYDITSKIWYWSFGLPFKSNNKIIIAKNIKKNMISIIKNKKNKFNHIKFIQSELEHILYFTKNGIYLTKESLDILIQLCIVLSNVEWIIPYKQNNNITFIAIKKILNSK
jgi:hypothetical protein